MNYARLAGAERLKRISVDATKVREWGEPQLKPDGTKSCPTIWRDAKIGAVSAIGWDPQRQEAFCGASSYVSCIEHGDLFFKRLTVEMNRRAANLKKLQVVFLADGANWIWERLAEMARRAAFSSWISITPANTYPTYASNSSVSRLPSTGHTSSAGKLLCLLAKW